MNKLFFTLFFLFAFFTLSFSQTITGKWKTVDDETGEAKSYVTIFKKDDKYFGKVSTILNKDRQNAVCDKCSDYRKGKPIKGMTIITNLEKVDDDKYSNGKILDPQKGKQYDLTIIPKGEDEIEIKGGYKVFGKMLGRTQTWYRVSQ